MGNQINLQVTGNADHADGSRTVPWVHTGPSR